MRECADPFEVIESEDLCYCIMQEDVAVALSWLPDGFAHFILTDVPYGLGGHEPSPQELLAYLQGSSLRLGDFMGENWEIPPVAVWKEILRCGKPGAHLFCYGSTKTFDVISMGIRMAGFEKQGTISDDHPCLQWVQSQGAAHGIQNVGKAIDKKAGAKRPVLSTRVLKGTAALSTAERGGTHSVAVSGVGRSREVPVTGPATEEAAQWEGYGSLLAPTWEPVLVFRRPLEGTLAENVLEHGTGALHIEACRVQGEWSKSQLEGRSGHSNNPDAAKIAGVPAGQGVSVHPDGRYPKDKVYHHAAGCTDAACVQGCPVQELKDQAGIRRSGAMPRDYEDTPNRVVYSKRGPSTYRTGASSGTADRFFSCFEYEEPDPVIVPWLYCPKASRTEREVGCERLPPRTACEVTGRQPDSVGQNHPAAGIRAQGEIRNIGKCIKPQAFGRWLARLGGVKGGVVLIPYAGTGSEVIACLREGMRVIAIECDPIMVEIARARIAWWAAHPGGITKEARVQSQIERKGQQTLFGDKK